MQIICNIGYEHASKINICYAFLLFAYILNIWIFLQQLYTSKAVSDEAELIQDSDEEPFVGELR